MFYLRNSGHPARKMIRPSIHHQATKSDPPPRGQLHGLDFQTVRTPFLRQLKAQSPVLNLQLHTQDNLIHFQHKIGK